MTEFDPATFLKQFRSKTPTRAPELPPRPIHEDPTPSKLSALEERLSALEAQLKLSQQNEQKHLKERDHAIHQLEELQTRASENEARQNEKIKFLEEMLERAKTRVKEDKPESRPKPPAKVEPKKPAFSSAVSSNSARYSKQKGMLDLTPLVELYKIMPDFPRPVIRIDFTGVRTN